MTANDTKKTHDEIFVDFVSSTKGSNKNFIYIISILPLPYQDKRSVGILEKEREPY